MAPTLLSIQSHVVYGHVGNSAVAFPLQRLGAEVLPLHTVQFSSHAGYPGWRGRVVRRGGDRRMRRRPRGGRRARPLRRRPVRLSRQGRSRRSDAARRRRRPRRQSRRRLLLRSGDRRRRTRRLCRSGRRRILRQARLAGGDGRDPQRVRTVVRHRPAGRRRRRGAARDRRLADDRTARRAGDVAGAQTIRPPTRST